MVAYPVLTPEQQASLPKLLAPTTQVVAKFDDSTHRLWRCETAQGSLMLKVCNQDNIDKSPFWHGMNQLFDSDFPAALASIEGIYQQLDLWSHLKIPQFVAAQHSVFVLAHLVDGETLSAEQVNQSMVEALTRHLAKLHQHARSNWGPLTAATFLAPQWSVRLQQTLQTLLKHCPHSIPHQLIEQSIAQAAAINNETFVPIMPDLRWDQFLHQHGYLTALVDLDALVYGPKELEFVLLEYLLDPLQAQKFIDIYTQHHALPNLDSVRMAYRMLLFLMQVLGETDIERWMAAPTRF